MELTKKDADTEKVRDSQDGPVFINEGQPSLGSGEPLGITPAKKSFEGKDALSYANILRSRNKFVDAFSVYETILEKDTENVEAFIGKGFCLQMQNLGRPAYESFAEAVRLDPQNACALTHCGILYKDEGRLVEAAELGFCFLLFEIAPSIFSVFNLVQMYQKALKADPAYKLAAECLAIVLTDLGTSLKLAGNTQEGIQKYYEAIKIDPHYAVIQHFPDFHNYFSLLDFLFWYLRFDVSVHCLQPAYYNLGVVYSEMMQYDTALNCYEKAAIERPMYAEAYCNMGVIYKNRGDLESAIACYERCLTVSPNFEIAKNNMAIALTDLGTKVKLEGDINQGIAYYKKALYYNWHYADAMYNLGVAYGEMLKFDMAIVFYELAFHFNPHCAEACNNLGVIYKDRDNLDKALALSIKANFSQSLNNLGVVYTVQGKMDAAASMIEKAIVANPTYAEAYNNLGVLYRDAGNISLAVEAYEQCLKIDPDSRNAGQGLGQALYEADAKTNRFRDRVLKNGGEWRDIYGIDEKKVASMVREDKIDILVELTGHTANNKLGMMACRPAPVQVTWIGYPNTAGLPTIDYRITDALADPSDTKQKHVEELVRLPDSFLCYTPSPEAGPVCPTPALSNGFVTFGSFNNLAKITPKVLQVWARILCAVPNSRLIVKCKPFCCESVRQQFLSALEKLGLESLRVDLLPLILLNHDHMQSYSLMDISLDTFPYAGTTTTCESLYMGVPCVAMRGLVHAHNVGVSLLQTVGLKNLVAENEDEYVERAVQLASDITALSNLRMRLRDLMVKSPLCHGSKFTRGLESAYRNMWHRYCKGDVPSLRRMELQPQQQQEQPHLQQVGPEELAIKFSEPAKSDALQATVKVNGFTAGQCSSINSSRVEENGSLPNQNCSSGKLS
ncbi:hypothetical protein SASPL_151658 [Salvia splendens]|uniref:protein O-GlcNAc transferase n=1 Tax=Salvia splendens TaxID=180675 RepID=A0A8X8Z365_SALSN|nr:hypothetical protein SASPL_151658 [Salvia splendens]